MERPHRNTQVVAVYCRVSTQQQEQDGLSLERQARTLQGYAQERLPGYGIEYYSDTSSGRKTSRPQYQRMMRAAKGGYIKAIVAQDLSRMWRCTKDAIEEAAKLREWRVELVLAKEGIDTSTAFGKAFFELSAVFAEFESNQLSERTRRAVAAQRREGRKGAGRRPYGWDVLQDGKLLRNEREQQAIDWALAKRVEGHSWAEIAEGLNFQNYQTASGGQWDRAGIRLVSASVMRRRLYEAEAKRGKEETMHTGYTPDTDRLPKIPMIGMDGLPIGNDAE